MGNPKRDYTVTEAQREFPAILERAVGGEAVAIRRRGRVVAQVAPVGEVGRAGARILGGMRDTAVMRDDLIAPLSEPWESV